jgi:predicted RNase H-like nuclease (RuvC/YqgF family)
MVEKTQETKQEPRWRDDLGRQLERLWQEVKDLSKQVESETRRGGRIAILRFDVRSLRRQLAEATSHLGRLVYDAQTGMSRRPALANVQGYDDAVARIDEIRDEIEVKMNEIAGLGGDAGQKADAA